MKYEIKCNFHFGDTAFDLVSWVHKKLWGLSSRDCYYDDRNPEQVTELDKDSLLFNCPFVVVVAVNFFCESTNTRNRRSYYAITPRGGRFANSVTRRYCVCLFVDLVGVLGYYSHFTIV